MKKQMGVLEQAGLVTTEKVDTRVRTCMLGPRRIDEETAWHERDRQPRAARFDERTRTQHGTSLERPSDGELVLTRTLNWPA